MQVTVFASSASAVDERYRAAVASFGARLAARGDELVYGGTDVGLMHVLADSVRRGGGKVTGVLPQLLVERGLADEDCDELVVTDGMSGRKQVMIARAQAFVALPGGFGTLEELLEVLTLKQLGEHHRPVVLFDVEGFYQPLLATFQHLFDQRFAKPEYAALYRVAREVDEVFAHLDSPDEVELPTKWY